MKAKTLRLALGCALLTLTAPFVKGFSIESVTLSPGSIVEEGVALTMTIDIVTPSQGTWLSAPTQVSTNNSGLRLDVYPGSGMLTAIGSLRETVALGTFPAGTHHYEVVIHPEFDVSWGTRTNRGTFTVIDETSPPVVYIRASKPETTEPAETTRIAPGEFTMTRLGNTNAPLILFLELSGTATPGEDYELEQYVLMPAGATAVTVPVNPRDDRAIEGDETVVATLSTNPPINSLPNYSVHPRLDHATVIIHDNDFSDDRPVVSISGVAAVPELCAPNAICVPLRFSLHRTGPGLNEPLTVALRYGGTAKAGVDYPRLPETVTFEPGEENAAVVTVPIDDSIYEGDETITAEIVPLDSYYVNPNQQEATIVLLDNEPFAPPVVSLEVVEAVAMETVPYQNAAFWAEFRVVRTGPVSNDLVVFLNTQQGSARFGEDYWLDTAGLGMDFGITNGIVRIPAGHPSVNVRLYPIDDEIYEGDETAFFHLILPPFASPVAPYAIDYEHSSVALVIRDNDPVVTRLEIASPENGEHFAPDELIGLRAQIIGPGSSNAWTVEFFDGEQSLGTTIPGGTIWWDNISGGQHVITARAVAANGDALAAGPVTIVVGPGPNLPVVRITGSAQTSKRVPRVCCPQRTLPFPARVRRTNH